MELTHWKKLTNPDYLGAYALEPGKDLIATIKVVNNEMVVGSDGKKEECTVAHFAERDIKPMILNVTNAKQIAKLLKTPYIEQWGGHKIQIGVEQVKAFGEMVEALRVRPFLPAIKSDEPIKCEGCSGVIKKYGKMSAKQLAEYTRQNYNKILCADCAAKAKAEKDAEAAASDVLGGAINNAGDAPEINETNEINENTTEENA